MLNHLFATILICMGVANTTPISNCNKNHVLTATKKNANITADYTLEINFGNYTQLNTNVLGTGNSIYPNATIENYQCNLQNNNSYINILGNYFEQDYTTTITDENNQTKKVEFIDNYTKIGEMGLRTCFAMLYKFTPYNYNVDTELEIKLRSQVKEFTDVNQEDFFAYEIYYERTTYYTSSANWDQFIGTQLINDKITRIQYEIENVNNGFFYTKNKELINIGYNNIDTANQMDEMTIQITPQTDNYYFIIYRPCVRFVYNTNEQTQPMIATNYPIKAWITGTNIIPEGTYEVVDIPGLMFEVIGMPFAFVSQAFNLTLFPGTPYQINIANLFLSIAAIFIFVWLLLLFIKMKG